VPPNYNAAPGQPGYVNPDALPGQPGYLDPITGMVIPSSSSGRFASNIPVVNDTSFPIKNYPTAFSVPTSLDNVETQAIDDSTPFNPSDIAFDNGIYATCVEYYNNGIIICATGVGGKFDSEKAAAEIIQKLSTVNPSDNGYSDNTTENDVTQDAVSLATQLKYPLQQTRYQSLVNRFVTSCNALRDGPVKQTCVKNGNMLSDAAGSFTNGINTLNAIGRMTGGSRKRGGNANRRKHRR
jgi:hypothetical protein